MRLLIGKLGLTLMHRLGVVLAALLLLVPGMPLVGAQQEESPTYHLDDATGDVAFTVVTGVATPGLPSAAVLNYVDLTAFTADDVDPLTLRVKVSTAAGFQPRGEQPLIIGGSPIYYSFMFQIPGTEATPAYGVLTFYGYWDDTSAGSTPAVVGPVQFCINTFYQDTYCGFAGALVIEPQYEDGTLVLDLPKTELTRSGQFAQTFPQLPGKIRPGDALTRVQILAHSQLLGYSTINGESPTELRDYVPNGQAPDLVFEHPSVTDDLRLDLSQVGVVAGEENIVGLEINNLADRKRLLDLKIGIDEMKGDWTVSIVPNATVRARDALNVTLRIVPPVPGTGPLPSIKFQIRAVVMTEPGVLAVIPVHLVASNALDRGEHTWYAHTGPASGGLGDLPGGEDLLNFPRVWASRLENDPAAGDTLGVPLYFAGGTNGVDFTGVLVATDGIPNPAKLLGEPGTAHLVIDSPFPMDVIVTSQVRTNDALIAIGNAEASFQRGVNEVDVSMPIDALATRLSPSDGQLLWDVTVHRPGIEGLPLAFVSIVDHPNLVAKESWFDLPLQREAVIPPDPDLPDVSLTAAEDPDAFVNPGRRTVFEWDLRNEHDSVIELELVVTNLTRQWPHEVGPSGQLRLPAGQSIRVAAILDAPADAKEGEVCEFKLILKEPQTDRVFAGGAARAIVTAGVDIDNESFEVDEEDLAAVRPLPAKSPGPEFVGLIAVAAVAVLALRRRLDD